METMNDWRLTNRMDSLYRAQLVKEGFVADQDCDHKHCSFCWAKFSEAEEELHIGYHTQENRSRWICEKCFDDFKVLYDWTVIRRDDSAAP